MRFSGAPRKLTLHFCLHLVLIAVLGASIVSIPAKCAAQSPQQVEQRLREQMERQRQQEQERQVELERERQQEADRERQQQREQDRQAEQQREQERQQEAGRERQQQLEQQQQAERDRQQQERQQQLEQARELANQQRRQVEPVNRPSQPLVPGGLELRFPPPSEPPFRGPGGLPVEPTTVYVTRPQPPAVTVIIPAAVNTLSSMQANVVLQEILSTEAAEVQAVTNGIDQIILALIQNSSNTELAKAIQNRMNQPDPLQGALNDQLAGFSAISQANANRACAAACANSSDVQRLSAQCNSGSQAACYQAAASLCQCSISNGGCGADMNQLQACVQQNTQSANSMRSSSTLKLSTSPGSMGGSQATNGGQNTGSGASGCSSSWSACPAD
jgi:DNA mismatch repair ATPase MutL